jgi:hypothetical protein
MACSPRRRVRLASNDGGINNGTTWTLFLTHANGVNLDLAIYGDRVWIAAPAFLGYAPVDNAGLADDSFAALTSDLEYHPMILHGGALKVGNGRHMGSLDESFAFTGDAMKLPVGYRIKAVVDYFGQLLMGIRFGAKGGDVATLDASVFSWRGAALSTGPCPSGGATAC